MSRSSFKGTQSNYELSRRQYEFESRRDHHKFPHTNQLLTPKHTPKKTLLNYACTHFVHTFKREWVGTLYTYMTETLPFYTSRIVFYRPFTAAIRVRIS